MRAPRQGILLIDSSLAQACPRNVFMKRRCSRPACLPLTFSGLIRGCYPISSHTPDTPNNLGRRAGLAEWNNNVILGLVKRRGPLHHSCSRPHFNKLSEFCVRFKICSVTFCWVVYTGLGSGGREVLLEKAPHHFERLVRTSSGAFYTPCCI